MDTGSDEKRFVTWWYQAIILGSGQLVPRTTRTQDNSYPRQLVPKTTRTQDNSYSCGMIYVLIWNDTIPYDIISSHIISRCDFIYYISYHIIPMWYDMIWDDARWYDMIRCHLRNGSKFVSASMCYNLVLTQFVDVTYASWHLMPPATRLRLQQLIQTNNKSEFSKSRKFDQRFHTMMPCIRSAFSCHDTMHILTTQ